MMGDLFQCHRRNVSGHAERYVSGLLSGARRKNIEGISEVIPDAKQEDLQHFLSDSPWAVEPVWKRVGGEASKCLGGGSDNMLLVDESAFSKKGKSSVGVARQYNGRLGKVDNCQVGVFASLSLGKRATLVGARLYLPQEWVDAPKRCDAAGIPKEMQVLKTKPELAWELIETTDRDGVAYGWVGMDAAYGRDQSLLLKIAGMGRLFVADVDCDQLVWLAEPAGKRRPKRIEESGARRVDAIWKESAANARPVELRSGENGPVEVQFWRRRVWIWPAECEVAMEVWLFVSEQSDGKVKYSLSNAPKEIGYEASAQRQGQRYFVERSFQNGKSHLGMAQYEVRGWRPWHHHMAMVGAAMYFTLLERETLKEEAPMLSVRDIVELIGGWFASAMTQEDLEERIASRHRRRIRQMQRKLRQAAAKKLAKKVPK